MESPRVTVLRQSTAARAASDLWDEAGRGAQLAASHETGYHDAR